MKKLVLIGLGILGALLIGGLSVYTLAQPDLGWLQKYLAMLGLGLVIALGLLFGATPRLLRVVGVLPFCSPNWLSLWRVPIVVLSLQIFLQANGWLSWLITGFLLVVFGLICDRLDGRAAQSLLGRLKIFTPANNNSGALADQSHLWAWYSRSEKNAQGETVQIDQRVVLEEWIYRLTETYTKLPMFRISRDDSTTPSVLRLTLTGIGEWLDPLMDKLVFLPTFCDLARRGLLSWYVVIPMVVVDLIGTVIREPFLSLPGFRWIQPHVRQSKASALGKTKVLWLILTLLAVMPAAAGWLNPAEFQTSKYIISSLLGLGVITAILSVISRLTLMPKLLEITGLSHFYNTLREGYEHGVDNDGQ